MKIMSRGPLLTLLAVVVAGFALLGVTIAIQPSAQPAAASAPAPATPGAPPGSPPPEPIPQRVKYVGYVTSDHGPIPMASTVESGRTKIYVCDGHKIESWMQGTAAKGSIDAKGSDGDHLTAHVSKGHLTGTMHLKGHPDWTFDVPSSSSSNAGIYRRRAGGRVSGWVVQGSGRQSGLTRDASGALSPAAPLPLDGPLPDDVSMVDQNTDLLAGS